ncbi:hypothetical protein V8C44DRAFT_64393 [Trichoderma aethiopicum]
MPSTRRHGRGCHLMAEVEGGCFCPKLLGFNSVWRCGGLSTASRFRANGSAAECRPRVPLSQVVGPLAIGPCSVSRHEASTNPQCKSVERIKAHALWFPNTTAGFLSLELRAERYAKSSGSYAKTCRLRYRPDGTRQQAHLNLNLSQQSRWHHVRDKPQASTVSALPDNSDAIARQLRKRCLESTPPRDWCGLDSWTMTNF